MLDELHVRNIALIEDADFRPSEGLTVVTGETGSGKSALLSALKLLVGERADTATVREGAPSAQVEGRFFLKGEAAAPDGHVVARRLGADGRSRVSVDGSMASVRELSERFGVTVDLCGQHEHQHLMRAANHAAMLDAWGASTIAPVLSEYRSRFREAEAAVARLEDLRERSRVTSAQVEEARFILRRIDEVAPLSGEYEEVMDQLPRAENAEELARASAVAYDRIASEGGALELINEAAGALEAMAGADPALAGSAESLREAAYLIEDVERDVRAYRDAIDRDPQLLIDLQERASALQGLMRAYGPRMEDVFAARVRAEEIVSSVDHGAELVARAQADVDEAESALVSAAHALDEAREAAAPLFEARVNDQLSKLEMSGAQLVCRVVRLDRARWTGSGSTSIEFLYRASESMTPRPLSRIASGGEISRVMLACKVVLGAVDDRETLVFDEVDAGVGGSVANALADVLADLAKTHQVIVVTHLAQVAVRADSHYVVQKQDGEDDQPVTCLSSVEGDARAFEIARMLSGGASAASLAHARELLGSA